MKFRQKVFKLTQKIPRGKISTYGEIARELETAPQAVGQALKRNPCTKTTPCHRVVKSNGKIGGYSGKSSGKKVKEKIHRLEEEGVEIENGKVVNFQKRLFRLF